MGLDFECNGCYERVGTYSYIPVLKKDWTKATIEFLRLSIKIDCTKLLNDEENYTDFPEIVIKVGDPIDATVLSQYIATGTYKDTDESDYLINLENRCYLYNRLLETIVKTPKLFSTSNEEEEEVVDYKKFKDTIDDLVENGLAGLVWINQIGSDGFLSVGQSLDILQTLERIAPFMEDTGFTVWRENEVKTKRMSNYYLYDIFNHSIKSSKPIRLC